MRTYHVQENKKPPPGGFFALTPRYDQPIRRQRLLL
jgi:hypothetical protein